MADFQNPTIASLYSDMVDSLKDRDVSALKWLDGTIDSNLPVGAKRWNTSNNYFENFNGSSWNPLTTKYMIDVDKVDGCTINDLGVSSTDVWTASKVISELSTKLSTSAYTAADILAKLQTVDGSLSGLDADLLDGKHADVTNTANTVVARGPLGQFTAGDITVNSVNSITGLSTTTPSAPGTASVGVSTTTARADHIHPIQTSVTGSSGSCTGNSATATSANSATLASKASTLAMGGSNGAPATFTWSGQSNQPSWLWGSNDGVNMYVWNPANFSVNYANSTNYATSAGSVGSISNLQWASHAGNGYIRLSTGLIIQYGIVYAATASTVYFPTTFPSYCASVVITDRGNGNVVLAHSTPTTSSFYWHDAGYAETAGIYWMAIGY